MAFMALSLPSPSNLIELGRFAVGQVVETAAAAATVPVRAMALLGQAELLVSRITVIADNAEALIERAGGIVTEAALATAAATKIVDEAAVVTVAAARIVDEAATTTGAANAVVVDAVAITGAASAVVGQAEATTAEVTKLLDGYAPALRQAAPLAARFVSELTPEEVTAAIRMIDELPKLREHLINDVMPLLGKLDQVGPDIHALLGATQNLHLAITGLPGLKRLRRRGEERVAEEAAEQLERENGQ
jgi:hypothetical protein